MKSLGFSLRVLFFAAGLATATFAKAADTKSAADIKTATDLIEAAKSSEAIVILDRIIEADPTDAKAYGLRGKAHRVNGDADQAMADQDKAIELNPKLPLPYAERGVLWADQKDMARAKADIDQAIKVDPKYAPAYASRGVMRRLEGKMDEAMADETKAIQLDPKFSRAYSNRARLELMKKDVGAAEADIKKAVELSPFNAFAYAERGDIEWTAHKDWHAAIADYSRAIRLSHKFAGYYYDRARIRGLVGDLDLALRDANVAVMLDPNSVGNRFLRSSILMEVSAWFDAIDDLDFCITQDPKNYEYRFRRGLAELQTGNRNALGDFDKAIELKPDSGKAFGYRGYVHYFWKEDDAAQKDYDQALKLDPSLQGELDMMRSFADEHSPKRKSKPGQSSPAPRP